MMSIFEWVPTLLLIFVAWKVVKQRKVFEKDIKEFLFNEKEYTIRYCTNVRKGLIAQADRLAARDSGVRTKMYISAKIAEKVADRAFNMASSANLGVIAMQKALVQPRLMTKEQLQRNQLAKKQIDEIFSEGDEVLNMLRPVASEEELEVIDKILEDKQRKQMNGEAKS